MKLKNRRQSKNIQDIRAETKAAGMYKGKDPMQSTPLMNRGTRIVNARSSRNQKAASMGNGYAISRILGGQRHKNKIKNPVEKFVPQEKKPVQDSYSFVKKNATKKR